MPHRKAHLTAAEAEIMNVIWDRERATIPEIVERIDRDLAYTTVMTTVKILEAKGFVEQAGKQGRAHIYQAVVGRNEVQRSMLSDLASRLFGGSLSSMVLSLMQQDSISDDDLNELKRIIDELESRK